MWAYAVISAFCSSDGFVAFAVGPILHWLLWVDVGGPMVATLDGSKIFRHCNKHLCQKYLWLQTQIGIFTANIQKYLPKSYQLKFRSPTSWPNHSAEEAAAEEEEEQIGTLTLRDLAGRTCPPGPTLRALLETPMPQLPRNLEDGIKENYFDFDGEWIYPG